ncbi:MAG: hypothetical protein IJI05_06095 [Erysipelotrichaceae bacterium]|nr:hypothetical protein [Erysipelotrichaceae bacterium]
MAKKSKIRWNRIAWKRVIPAGILLILVLYFIISLIVGLFTGGKSSNIYTVCNLNGKQTLKAVGQEDHSSVTLVKDYKFYGEHLNFYVESYDRSSLETVIPQADSIVLADLCSNKQYEFEMQSAVDGQIDLAQLTPGFYAVYLKSGEKLSRIYLDRTILTNNVIHTVTRKSLRTRVEIIANRKQFDSPEARQSVLDQPYVYLKVTEEAVSSDTAADIDYDIVISIAPALTMDHISLVGDSGNGITEAEELWSVATELKNTLAENGYKVKMLKDAYNAPYLSGGAFYGTDGVLNRAYDSKAKYFIYLDMGIWGGEVGVYHSGFALGKLSESIFGELNTIGLLNGQQLTASSLESTNHGTYDEDYEIREAGGVVLGAGTYSETSVANSGFAGHNIYGIETVKIVTTDITDASSVSLWREKKSQVAQAIYRGIASYLEQK